MSVYKLNFLKNVVLSQIFQESKLFKPNSYELDNFA